MIIITGGTSGLGAAITNNLRNSGIRVITISRKEKYTSSDHFTCDVSDYSALKSIYNKLSSCGEHVSALINCAGIASMNLAITTPPHITKDIVRTNLIGTIFSSQVFAPLLIKNKSGRIINFSTIAVQAGLKGESIYVASKAGVEAFSRVLANELSTFNITVNCIAPGPIKTNLLKGISEKQIGDIVNRQIIKNQMKPSDIVQIVSLLLSEGSCNITGQVLHVGGI